MFNNLLWGNSSSKNVSFQTCDIAFIVVKKHMIFLCLPFFLNDFPFPHHHLLQQQQSKIKLARQTDESLWNAF